ncbi:MAG: DUF3277 family protein [Candidatus Marinimicrobia bacterium]|nr:DUF3277 family protein [Candidatus Neomarinimicrobiota bacterium]
MAGKSSTYSFAANTITMTLKDSVGAYLSGVPIDLSLQGFWDKTDNIVIEPMTELIVDDIGPDGEMYPSITEDRSGTVTINSADKTPLHKFLVAILNGHRDEKNIKGIDLAVRSRSVGGTGELIYSAKAGYFQPAASRKGFGSRQTGNTYSLRFEEVIHNIEE